MIMHYAYTLITQDSPLVRAAKYGRVLLVDEADKAPLEVRIHTLTACTHRTRIPTYTYKLTCVHLFINI
jgi:AAA domain (dynein-related subfamily)